MFQTMTNDDVQDRDDSDSDLFEYFATISLAENDRIQQERADDEEETEPPF